MVVVAWPEGIHHVLALPQDQQQSVGQGQNKEPSEHADGTVLQPQQVGHNSKSNCKNESEEHFKSLLKVFKQDEFWDCFTHPAYTDLDLIMQDSRLPVNR